MTVKPLIRRHDTVLGTHRAVERTFAWLTAHRCLARDYERDPALSEAMIRWAAINTMTRGIARGDPPSGSNGANSPLQVDLLKHLLK
jgi:hypothetical protein